MGDLLSTGEAAALLGVSKPTVVRAIQRGLLRPALITPGQHRRFRRDDLLAFRASTLRYPEASVSLTGHAVLPVSATGEADATAVSELGEEALKAG
jgi:excisionase family DNA binding protein